MIPLDIWSRTKKSNSDSQFCQKSDSDSTQKPLTPYDSAILAKICRSYVPSFSGK